MTQKQIQELLNVPERTLRDWKKGNRAKLYQLLKSLDYSQAEQLLNMNNNNDLKKLVPSKKVWVKANQAIIQIISNREKEDDKRVISNGTQCNNTMVCVRYTI